MAIWFTAQQKDLRPGVLESIGRFRGACAERMGEAPLHKAELDGQDAFDHAPNALHVVEWAREAITFSFRLLPTIGPTPLAAARDDLLGGAPPPRDPQIWEWGRCAFAASGAQTVRANLHQRRMHVAALELFLGLRVRAVSALVHPSTITTLLEIGYRVQPLALPRRHAGRMVAPVLLHPREETLERARAMFEIFEPVLDIESTRPPAAPAIYA